MKLFDKWFVGVIWACLFAILLIFLATKLSEKERAEYETFKYIENSTGLKLRREEESFQEGINQGRIEIFTGQVICRQAPLQGTDIQLECKTRKEILDTLQFVQPKDDIK